MCENKSGGCGGGCGGGREIGLMAEAVRQALLPTGTLAVRTGLIAAANANPLSFDWHVPFAAVAVNVVSSAAAASGGVPTAVSNSFAAAAAGSVALPAGYSVTGIDITAAAGSSVANASSTLTNLAAGTLNFTWPQSSALDLVRTFPAPLPASSGAAQPTLAFPATVGGPAYSLTIYGQTPAVAAGTPQPLTIVAGPPAAAAPGPGPGVVQLPANRGGVFNLRGNSLTVYGGTAGDVVIVQAFTKPQPASWG